MGRRAGVVCVVVGAMVAAGQIWLMAALMSRQLADGQSGWAHVAEAKPRTDSERSPDKAIVEILGITYGCDSAASLGEQAVFRIRVNRASPGCRYWSGGSRSLAIEIRCPGGGAEPPCYAESYPAEYDVTISPSGESGPIRWTVYGFDENGERYVAEQGQTPWDVIVDTTTRRGIDTRPIIDQGGKQTHWAHGLTGTGRFGEPPLVPPPGPKTPLAIQPAGR